MADRIEEVKKLFTSKSARVDTNRGNKYYEELFQTCKTRIEELKTQQPVNNRLEIADVLEMQGIQRRDFLKWVSATTAMLMLPASFNPLVADAVLLMNRAPVIWLELQDCAGNSEALLRSDGPKIDEIVLDIISLEFHETLQAAAGHQAEAQLEDAMKTFDGKYLLFVEGSVPIGA